MRLPLSVLRSHCCSHSACSPGFGSAYNARPKLVVIIVIDQFRGDYLERYRDQFSGGGFRLFLDHALTSLTATTTTPTPDRLRPRHSSDRSLQQRPRHHQQRVWDRKKTATVTSVQTMPQSSWGSAAPDPGSSPHNLLADTLATNLKLATTRQITGLRRFPQRPRRRYYPPGFAGDASVLD